MAWNSKATSETYEYISKYSPQNAQKVKEDILNSTRSLISNQERHPPDKYRKNNDKTFRAYEVHGFRISYKISEKEIIIVRLRHTKMKPKPY